MRISHLKHLNLNRYIPNCVLNFGYIDGRWLSITVEGLLPQIYKDFDEKAEIRVVSKTGCVNCLPAYQKGFGRSKNIEAFKNRCLEISCFYLILRTYNNHVVTVRVNKSEVKRRDGKLNKSDLLTLLPEELHKWL
jgi:hypothetical protein